MLQKEDISQELVHLQKRRVGMQRIVTWPNIITVGRLFLGLGGIWIARQTGWFIYGVSLFFIGGMLPDALDGWVARKYNQKTRLGEFIDPLVDKILFYAAIIFLFFYSVSCSILIILLVCDITSTIVHLYKKGGAVKTGKWKFMLQCSALIFFVLSALMSKKFIEFINMGMESAMLANGILVCALFCATHSLYHRFFKT